VTDPILITADQYAEALDCMPPCHWIWRNGIEAFKFSERLYGSVTTIYAKIETSSRYFKFDDRLSVMHDDIAAKVKKACGLETAMKQ